LSIVLPVMKNFDTNNVSMQHILGLLNLIADIGYLTFILSFTTNFVIFYKFNKNFKESVFFSWTSKIQTK
jgi:hypothetical protein